MIEKKPVKIDVQSMYNRKQYIDKVASYSGRILMVPEFYKRPRMWAGGMYGGCPSIQQGILTDITKTMENMAKEKGFQKITVTIVDESGICETCTGFTDYQHIYLPMERSVYDDETDTSKTLVELVSVDVIDGAMKTNKTR